MTNHYKFHHQFCVVWWHCACMVTICYGNWFCTNWKVGQGEVDKFENGMLCIWQQMQLVVERPWLAMGQTHLIPKKLLSPIMGTILGTTHTFWSEW